MKRQKTMTPEDASKYCDICPQFFREMLKANKVDFGVAVNPTGRRWRYAIVPQKFFDWLGIPVPVEWR